MKLLLIHGRDDPDANMEDWGYHGQTLEGLAYLHSTYGNLTAGFVSKEAAAAAHTLTGWPYFDDAVLEVRQHEDLIQTTNMVGSSAAFSYFGDFELIEDCDPVGADEWPAALDDLLGDRPSVQGGICQHCGRDYSDDVLEGNCQSDNCPSVTARAAIAKARGATCDVIYRY